MLFKKNDIQLIINLFLKNHKITFDVVNAGFLDVSLISILKKIIIVGILILKLFFTFAKDIIIKIHLIKWFNI